MQPPPLAAAQAGHVLRVAVVGEAKHGQHLGGVDVQANHVRRLPGKTGSGWMGAQRAYC